MSTTIFSVRRTQMSKTCWPWTPSNGHEYHLLWTLLTKTWSQPLPWTYLNSCILRWPWIIFASSNSLLILRGQALDGYLSVSFRKSSTFSILILLPCVSSRLLALIIWSITESEVEEKWCIAEHLYFDVFSSFRLPCVHLVGYPGHHSVLWTSDLPLYTKNA